MTKRIIALLLILSLFFPFVAANNFPEPSAVWAMDSTNLWYDYTENGANGTNNGVTRDTTNIIWGDSVGSFADDWGNLGEDPINIDAGDWMLGFWINTTSTSQGYVASVNDGAGSRDWYMRINNGGRSGEMRFAIYDQAESNNIACVTASGTGFNDGDKHSIFLYYKASTKTAKIYLDHVEVCTDTGTGTYSWDEEVDFHIGDGNALDPGFVGIMDEPTLWDELLTTTNMTYWENSGGWKVYTASPPPFQENFTILHIRDRFTKAEVQTNVTIDNGTIYKYYFKNYSVTEINNDSVVNITLYNVSYMTKTLIDYNTSIDLDTKVTPKQYIAVTFTNYTPYNVTNYTRELNYNLSYVCESQTTTQLIRNVEGEQTIYTASCNNETIATFSGSYIHNTDGYYNISFRLNSSFGQTETKSQEFKSDITEPKIVILRIDAGEGFTEPYANLTLQCLDNTSEIVNYTMIFNGDTLFNATKQNNATQINESSAVTGVNTLRGYCRDFFGQSMTTETMTIYTTQLNLIDERTGTALNLDNVTIAKLYYDDNSSYYDFKGEGETIVNFTSNKTAKLRLELGYYTDSDKIYNKYLDLTLLDDDTRICANKENVNHYEILITAATQKPAVVKSVYADCVIVADYTRFAYQNTLMVKAYMINTMYYLYTYNQGAAVYLAAIDGSETQYVNLDNLEFQQEGYNIQIWADALSFEDAGSSTIKIYYKNINGDNTDLSYIIKRIDTGETLVNVDVATPNNFTTYFNWATLSNVTEETLFQIELTKTTGSGTTTIKRYFNTRAKTGILNAKFAAVIAALLVIFGMTFTLSRLTFSWFGIVIQLAAIAFLSFAISEWYIVFMQIVIFVIMAFTLIKMIEVNYGSVA